MTLIISKIFNVLKYLDFYIYDGNDEKKLIVN